MYITRKLLSVADALSRCPGPESTIETADSDPVLMVSTVVQVSPTKLKQIQETTDLDPTLQQLTKYINMNGQITFVMFTPWQNHTFTQEVNSTSRKILVAVGNALSYQQPSKLRL